MATDTVQVLVLATEALTVVTACFLAGAEAHFCLRVAMAFSVEYTPTMYLMKVKNVFDLKNFLRKINSVKYEEISVLA